MSIEEILRSTIPMLNSLHILAAEAETMAAAKKNLLSVISALEKARKEVEENDNHDRQGENV
ncbi:MAG: hypothetical protein SPG80_08310 [Candidatus Ventricola sp.]|nr:hypothetical protein [Candidatus Ventricola sp.]